MRLNLSQIFLLNAHTYFVLGFIKMITNLKLFNEKLILIYH